MADRYTPQKDEGYKNRVTYTPAPRPLLSTNNYALSSFAYRIKQESPKLKVKSKCPRGAIMGDIGSCCGNACTRACAIPD